MSNEERDRVAGTALSGVRADAPELAARWAKRVNGVQRDGAALSDATFRNEAEALIALLLDAAEARSHPPPAPLARHLNRIAEIHEIGSADPYELIETLDGLCELMHESLDRQMAQLNGASATAALTAARRLSRALRAMVAAASLVRFAAAGGRDAAASEGEGGGGSGTGAAGGVGAGTTGGAAAATATGGGAAAQQADEFVRRLAHDLKNPLGTAKGAAETLIDASALENAEQRQQFAEIVIRSLDRAVELIDSARRERKQDV